MFLLFLLPFLIFIFYIFNINLSIDTLNLFLPQKIFEGAWLLKGIFPLYNPHIFNGAPFAFDLGLGNFHPFNLFFLLPYPFSFAVWTFAVSFLFLIGFYLFFSVLTKTKKMALFLTIVLFFSGSGFFLRMNNPTIIAVISHLGFFLYYLRNLKQKKIYSIIAPLFFGVMMTLAGHIQFVLYGYFLGLIITIFFYKIPLKKIILFYLSLFILMSWYFIFAFPAIAGSTRLINSGQSFSSEKIIPLQYLQLILPFIFGETYNGARWNIGYSSNILISIFFLPLLIYIFLKGKYNKWLLAIFLFVVSLSLGLIMIPFFRISSQIIIVFHILGLAIIATNEAKVKEFISKLSRYKQVLICLTVIILLVAIFSQSSFFPKSFLIIYKTIKHRQTNLFFDLSTINAIGKLFAMSLFLLFLAMFFLLVSLYRRKEFINLFIVYVIIEGIIINFFFIIFIPGKYIPNNFSLPKNIDIVNYRIQTVSDVIPYFGLSNYIDNAAFRPPFSKEKSLFTKDEQKTFAYFENIMSYIPSNWSMIAGIKTIQGYNTFVPKKLAEFFTAPSSDFRKQYAQILEKNSEFSNNLQVSDINAINTTFITTSDIRWQNLGVRYFISDRPLDKFILVDKDNRYFYENTSALPLYYIVSGDEIGLKKPLRENPNEIIFIIKSDEIGKTLVINLNPAGFTVEQNGKKITFQKENFKFAISLKTEGELKIYYSPLTHLKESLYATK